MQNFSQKRGRWSLKRFFVKKKKKNTLFFSSENTVSDTQACDIKVDILPSGFVKLQWTVDKNTIWGDFLFAKYTMKATEVDSGKCVYKRENNIHLPTADGSVQNYIVCLCGS